MRVINDKQDHKAKGEQVSLLSLPLYALLCGIGFSSIMMAPLAVIWVHRRLPEFWPKVVSIAGAVVALLLLEVPLPAVLMGFVFGVFVADSVQRQVPLWLLAFRSMFLAAFLGFLGLGVFAKTSGQTNLMAAWEHMISLAVAQAQQSGLQVPELDWELLKRSLFYSGPFYYLGASLLSFWMSVGFAAHLGWQSDQDAYCANQLREVRLPLWSSLLTVALWTLEWFAPAPQSYWIAGVVNLLVVFLFIQGSVTLSLFFNKKGYHRGIRSLAYVLFMVFGFYALVGLGLMSPLIFLKNRRAVALQSRPLEEAV